MDHGENVTAVTGSANAKRYSWGFLNEDAIQGTAEGYEWRSDGGRVSDPHSRFERLTDSKAPGFAGVMVTVPFGDGGNPSPSGEGKVGEMAQGHEPFWSAQDAWHIPMFCSRLRADNV